MEEERGKPRLKGMIQSIRRDLEAGKSLSESLSVFPHSFDPVTIGLVRAGEFSGALEPALTELARHLESEMETRQKLHAALAYPAFLLLMAASVSFFLIAFVIPRFRFLFEELGQSLPLPTRILMTASSLFQSFYFWIIATSAGVLVWRSKPANILSRFTWVADFMRPLIIRRWAHVMSLLIKNGFTVTEALTLSRETTGAPSFSAGLLSVERSVNDGASLSEALAACPFIPPETPELLAAGEESGQLDVVFGRIAESARRESELRLKTGLSFLEPLLILLMGGVVGFVALAMILPIFEISGALK
jgi:type II secretory pathway component PulF